jgi:hypothetical protein
MTPPSDNAITKVDNVFVWAWLPGQTEPVVAGRLRDAASPSPGSAPTCAPDVQRDFAIDT